MQLQTRGTANGFQDQLSATNERDINVKITMEYQYRFGRNDQINDMSHDSGSYPRGLLI